jgi:hypothetical protein
VVAGVKSVTERFSVVAVVEATGVVVALAQAIVEASAAPLPRVPVLDTEFDVP